MAYFEIEKHLLIAINDGKAIEIVSPCVDEATEDKLQYALKSILDRYEKSHLQESLFACIVELATNGTKANMKHIFFEESGMDIADPEQHRKGRQLFKEQTHNIDWMKEYAAKALERGYFVKIVITHTPDGLRIEVMNNRPLLPDDERRIRQKLEFGMQYTNIIDYYQEHADDAEGEGLGFALNLILMKAEKIDTSLFRIIKAPDATIARIEIPFNEKFETSRKKGNSMDAPPPAVSL